MARRQREIPGIERPTIPELDEVCAPYTAARSERMELQKQERELKKQIDERMKALKVRAYVFYNDDDEGYNVTRERGKVKVTVTKLKPDEDVSAGEGEDDE